MNDPMTLAAGRTPSPASAAATTSRPNRSPLATALGFEWTKFVTLRSNLVTTAILGAILPLFAVIVAATGSLQPDDTILGASVLGGAVIAQILAGALGATFVTSEIRTGMMRTTLLACPRHRTILAAKSLVVAAAVATTILPAALVSYGIGLLLLDQETDATGRPFPAVAGIAMAIASLGVLGVAIGSVVRHSAGAVVTVVAVVLVPWFVAPMLGDLERWLGGASLNGVMQKLTQSSDATHQAVGSLGAWPSLAVVAAYTIAAVATAVVALRRRDS